MTSFAKKSTLSVGKTQTEEEIDNIIRPHVFNQGKAILLVGSHYGLDRHINRMIELGYHMRNIIIVEYDESTAISLQRACRKRYPKVKVVHSELLAFLKTALNQGLNVEYIEADGVLQFNKWFDLGLVGLFKKYKCIKSMSINGSIRGSSNDLKDLAKEYRFNRTTCKNRGIKYYSPKKIIPKVLDKVTDNSIETRFRPYQGVSPMYYITLTRTVA